MNAEEIQYALDRRNHVDISGNQDANVIDKPIQLGHLTGEVVIESSTWGGIGYLGPAGRAVFEYNYTGVQDPPRIYFRNIHCRNAGVGTYNVANVAFFRVIQANTSPKALHIRNCVLANEGSYLIDGKDVSGCDGISILHTEAGGSGLLRWRLRDAAEMLFLEIRNTRYQTNDLIGPHTDLKNTRGIHWLVLATEQNVDLIPELVNEYVGPVSHRFVNPRGFNLFEHNWNEYGSDYDTVAPGCWGTSIRVDDVTGNYGMHFIRTYQHPMSEDSATGVNELQYYGGHDSSNAGSLYVEKLDNYASEGEILFAGKVYPKLVDGLDVATAVASSYTDLNSGGLVDRLEIYDADGQPVHFGNTRTPYYNTSFRLDRTNKDNRDYEDLLLAQEQKAYGGKNSFMTFDGSDVVITFKGNDTLVVTEEIDVEYLIAGGGGSGGAINNTFLNGGGGGAGGYASNFGGTPVTLSPGSYPIVVGAGGKFTWGTYGTGTDGGSSSFNGITIPGGGGGGGSEDLVTYTDGNPGGCGGGASGRGGAVGGAGSAYGYAGGSSNEASGSSGPSGGGGAGGAGGNGYLDGVICGGDGGAGVANAITGTSVTYCEGGGGGTNVSTNGDGGVEGGGWPRTFTQGFKVRDGLDGLGGGGAGGSSASGSIVSYPGNGGSGVVIIRFSSI